MPGLMQKIIFLLSVVFLANPCFSQTGGEQIANPNLRNVPDPIGYVNDFAIVLDSLDRAYLETKLGDFDKQTTNQIVIIILDSDELTEENFDRYALYISNYWEVGTKEKNNGLTIVISPVLRRIRINTGLGTEKILTDEICKDVLQTIIVPEFKDGNYFEGLDQATDEFIRLWK